MPINGHPSTQLGGCPKTRSYDHPFFGFFFPFFLHPTVRIESDPSKLRPVKVIPLSDAAVSPQRIHFFGREGL